MTLQTRYKPNRRDIWIRDVFDLWVEILKKNDINPKLLEVKSGYGRGYFIYIDRVPVGQYDMKTRRFTRSSNAGFRDPADGAVVLRPVRDGRRLFDLRIHQRDLNDLKTTWRP